MAADNRKLAETAYSMIRSKAESNSFIQGLTGLAGFPWTIAADAVVIPTIYMPLWNDIRRIYGYDEIETAVLARITGRLVPEIFADIALDKFLGNVPVIGIYFNAICAKAMTWRLGILFAFMSNRVGDMPDDLVVKAMRLIREVFPQRDMFKFATPDKEAFVRLVAISSTYDTPTLDERINKALDVLDE